MAGGPAPSASSAVRLRHLHLRPHHGGTGPEDLFDEGLAVERQPCSPQVTSAIIIAMTINGEAAQDHPGGDGDVLPAAKLRVALAEDDILLREGLASMLESHG